MALSEKKLFYSFKAFLYLVALISASPICMILCILGTIVGVIKPPKEQELLPVGERKTILISGVVHTKGLHVAKTLAKVGHDVILADMECFWFSAARFSRYIHKFCTVPNIVSNHDYREYVEGMVKVAVKEKVDWYIPVSHTKSSIADSIIKEHLSKQGVKCLALDAAQAIMLDDKVNFFETCRKLKLSIPDYEIAESIHDVIRFASTEKASKAKYFLKPLKAYSEDRENFTLMPTNAAELQKYLQMYEGKISKDTPYMISQFIQGREFALNCIVSSGTIQASQVCSSSPMQIDYAVVEHPRMFQWAQKLCTKENLTGSLSLDFMEDAATKEIYCLECNPRLHSAVVAFNMSPELAKAYGNAMKDHDNTNIHNAPTAMNFESTSIAPAKPEDRDMHVYWLYNEIGKLMLGYQSTIETYRIIKNGKDALWDSQDLMPFFMLNTFHMPIVMWQAVSTGKQWRVANFCLGGVRW